MRPVALIANGETIDIKMKAKIVDLGKNISYRLSAGQASRKVSLITDREFDVRTILAPWDQDGIACGVKIFQ